jgi:hypothetical protein
MLTFVESISLAGDRGKQNDDALGFAGGAAWVIDGATDLHDKPLMETSSDAAWLAHVLNTALHGFAYPTAGEGIVLRKLLQDVLTHRILPEFQERIVGKPVERWQRPIASLALLTESPSGVTGIDLGDSRVFALAADGVAHVAGGSERAADAETALASKQTDASKPLLERTETIDMLRRMRAELNQPGASWTFCLDPDCAKHAPSWSFRLKRPAHLLLMTDGFSALADRYRAYDPAGLVRAALDKGLQELGRELREIESADAAGAKHPRFKPSDDATALLMRLS